MLGPRTHDPALKWLSIFVSLVVAGLGACSSSQATSDAFDYPFGKSTASKYYQALYDGSLTKVDGPTRAIDLLVGGPAVDYDTYSLFTATSGPAGIFLGDNLRAGAKSKILRWWDYYGEGSIDYENSVQTAVGIVDFDNARHAKAAMRIEARKVNTTIEEVAGANGIEIWATSTDQGARTVIYSLPPNDAVVIFVSCSRYGTFETKDVCNRTSMRRVRDEIAARIPQGSEKSKTSTVAGPNFRDDGWRPIVNYEFDVDQVTRSYLDPDGILRTTWKSKPPSGDRYQWTGFSSAYSLGSSETHEPGLQVRVDQIPVGSTDPALKLVATICFDQSGARSPYCGDEEEIDPYGNLLGGRVAVAYVDPSTKVIESVRSHVVTSQFFIDFHCGHPWTSDEQGISTREATICKKVIRDLAQQIAS